MSVTIKQRKAYQEPKTGDLIDPSVLLAEGIDPATCDIFTYWIAVDDVSGCKVGMRFASEQQARDYYAEAVA